MLSRDHELEFFFSQSQMHQLVTFLNNNGILIYVFVLLALPLENYWCNLMTVNESETNYLF